MPAPAWRSRSGTALDDSRSQTIGERIPMITGLGMTETAPFVIFVHGADVDAPA